MLELRRKHSTKVVAASEVPSVEVVSEDQVKIQLIKWKVMWIKWVNYVSASNAGASSQTFNAGGGPFGGGFSGGASNAAASSQTFNQVCFFSIYQIISVNWSTNLSITGRRFRPIRRWWFRCFRISCQCCCFNPELPRRIRSLKHLNNIQSH